ncbi:hypothetical protein K439DRAFT_587302 [Ramaria rubella]|nr:hypothetical protein K439DRAFT_587302 [Ramaria rubella]
MHPSFETIFDIIISPRFTIFTLTTFFVWRAYRLLKDIIYGRLTALRGLTHLGTERQHKIKGTAVICGGSISGILTARVCADHFQRVLVVEPEPPSMDITKPRSRILQRESLHAYTTFFLEALRRIWPDFDAEVRGLNGMVSPGDFKAHFGGVIIPPPYEEYLTNGLPEILFLRRTALERLLHRLLTRTCTNTAFMVGTVRKLVPSYDHHKIDSVIVRTHTSHEQQVNDVWLVADCTGSSQSGLKWLKAAGYEIPHDLRVSYDHKMHYVTTLYTVTEQMRAKLLVPGGYENAGFLYTFVADYRWGNAGFVLSKMDGDTIELCCGGWGDVHLPKKSDDIEGFVRSLRGPVPVPTWVLNVLTVLNENGSPVFHPVKIPPCSWVQYRLLSNLPSNFIAIGDSEMQLNPVFAQGCSKSMLGAITLNTLLLSYDTRKNHSLPNNLSRRFFRKIDELINPLWLSTKALDYGFKTTVPVAGETLEHGKLIRSYTDRVLFAAEKDRKVASALWHVRMLMAPPTDLFTPMILLKVLYSSFRLWWKGAFRWPVTHHEHRPSL